MSSWCFSTYSKIAPCIWMQRFSVSFRIAFSISASISCAGNAVDTGQVFLDFKSLNVFCHSALSTASEA